jgi:hypothetical protein
VFGNAITITQAHSLVFETGCAKVGGSLPTGCTSNGPNIGWGAYTGGFLLTPPPNEEWSIYHSQFASNFCGGTPNELTAPNYDYFCNALHDTFANLSEFTPNGVPAATNYYLQVAMDQFGNHTAVANTYARNAQFVYLKGWTGVSDANGLGPTEYNGFTLGNAWNPTPASIGPNIRWGQKQGVTDLNPFTFNTVWEDNVVASVYDGLFTLDPYDPTHIISWLGNGYSTVTHATDLACPSSLAEPSGTFSVGACVKFNLRGNVFFHDGTRLKPSDVKFSTLAFNATGGLIQPSTVNVIDVLYASNDASQPQNIYIALHVNSPFTYYDLAGIVVVPEHIWQSAAGACATKGTAQCTINPSFISGPGADPVANNRLVGSGPWVCSSAPLGTVGVVIGGGCSSSGSQTVAAGGTITLHRYSSSTSASSLSTNGAYFRTNGKYKQFQWADENGDGTVNFSDLSTLTPCFTSTAPPVGPCVHWNSPAGTITPVATAGPLVGQVGGGNNDGTCGTLGGCWLDELGQAGFYSGVKWTAPFAYTQLTGAQPAPQTLYEDGSQEN